MSIAEYSLHFRRYAPFESFGIPSFKGDGRQTASTSLSPSVTSRTHGMVVFNQSGISKKKGSSSGTHSDNFVLNRISSHAVSKVSISAIRSREAGPGLLGFSAKTAGSNPLLPVTPDIDTRVELRVNWGMGKNMQISGILAGDDFPNAEVFVRCHGSGKSVLLVDGRTDRGRRMGPFSLIGSGDTLCSFNAEVPLNDNGHFVVEKTCLPRRL